MWCRGKSPPRRHTARHLSALLDPRGARERRPTEAGLPARPGATGESPAFAAPTAGARLRAEAVRGADFSGSAPSVRDRPGERGNRARPPQGRSRTDLPRVKSVWRRRRGQPRAGLPLHCRAVCHSACSQARPTRNQWLSEFSRVNSAAVHAQGPPRSTKSAARQAAASPPAVLDQEPKLERGGAARSAPRVEVARPPPSSRTPPPDSRSAHDPARAGRLQPPAASRSSSSSSHSVSAAASAACRSASAALALRKRAGSRA